MNQHEKIAKFLLPAVRNPAQYIGGEVNQISKQQRPGDVTIALGFPDTYALGMSYLGYSILYAALNRMDNVIAERVYCPWLDAAEIMEREGIELFSWESRKPIREFDILGITLQHELSYSNILFMLDVAGVTMRAEQRSETEPLVIGGGPISDSCEPMADFFDLIVLGDGEDSFCELVSYYRELRLNGVNRREMLLAMARKFPWAYVPQFYECRYNEDGILASILPTESGVGECVERATVTDLENAIFPTAPLIPHTETPHNRIAIEIMRGCPQRCAFCHAGFTRGKMRYRSIEKIVDIAWQSYRNTGHDTVSLLSLSTSDYPELTRLAQSVYNKFEGCHVGISLPSLRVDKQLKDVPASVTGARREGLTVAVEAASVKIRKAIGKQVTDKDLKETMKAAFAAGWRKVKLYFMIGFPGETDEDIMGILKLATEISNLRRETHGGPAAVNVTISWLAPKPHTPLAFEPQKSIEYFQRAKKMLLEEKWKIKGKSIKLKFHHIEKSVLEAILSRGDRRLGAALEAARRLGAWYDSWDECFDYDRYLQAFNQCDIDPLFYANRRWDVVETAPWDHLAGANKQALYKRYQRIKEQLER